MDQIDDGIAAARSLLDIGERASSLTWPYGAAYLAKFLPARGRTSEAEDWIRLAREKSDYINDTMLSGTVALMGGSIYTIIGDQREAQAWYGRELQQPRSAQSQLRPELQVGLAIALGHTGNMREARLHLAELKAIAPVISFWEGDWAKAEGAISARLIAAQAIGSHYAERINAAAQGLPHINRIRGEYGRARTFGERGLALAEEAGYITFEYSARGELALTLGTAGLTREAVLHLERCHQILALGEDWRGMAGLVPFAEGVVASVQDLDLAERHFETAAETYRLFELVWRESDVFY
jgi:tetratricopeptide (TPR) repeat protein